MKIFKISSYSLEALHADPSHRFEIDCPNLIEIRKFGDIFVKKQWMMMDDDG